MRNLILIAFVAFLASSCGETNLTPCECYELRAKTVKSADKDWCTAKEANDEAFKKGVQDCAIKALGHDPKDVVSSTDVAVASEGTYNVNTQKSNINWTGRKAVGSHSGKLSVKSGSFTLGDDGVPSTGKLVVDMTSITCTDIEDEKSNADLVGHLMSPDFFDVENHGEAIFEITSTKKVQGSGAMLYGNLTIKGITKPCEGIITVIPSKTVKGQVNLSSAIKFDRTEYNIKHGSGKFFENLGDKMIKDEVSLQVTLASTPN